MLNAKIRSRLSQFKNDTSGATAIEYGLIVGLIAIALIASLQLVSASTIDKFEDVSSAVLSATAT